MRPPVLRIAHDELIADNFAGGGGASLGIEWGLGRSPDIAINHDAEAIAMHAANHPDTKHFTESIWKVDPREVCRSRPALAWFSPDCKHFSKAKGGKPVDKNIRGLAWVVILWAKTVKPRVILLENVEEFEDWGPLLNNGKPDPDKRGLTFRIWKGKLEGLGYKVEHREIVAADHGAPTSRKRLFLVARCDGLPIVWPKSSDTFRVEDRRVAADCIDFSLPTYSIFLTKDEARQYGVKRPLAENTLRRVARGLQRFVIDSPTPFIVPVMHGAEPRVWSINEPMRTITGANRGDRALVMPFITEHANASSPRSWRADEPLRTQCAQVKGGHFALVAPYLAGVGGRKGQSPETGVDRPYHTITAKGDTVVVAPFMVPRYGERKGQDPRALSVDRTMPTIVPTQNGAQLVAAFLAKHNGGHEATGQVLGRSVDTITARENKALVTSSLVKLKGTARDGQQLNLPLHTVQAGGNHYGEVRAFLMKYYGTEQAPQMEAPLHSVTSRDRFGLVTVHGQPYRIADIGMRMLAPRELFRAQGFHDDYIIDPVVDGRRLPKDVQVRCVGNSVCPPIAAALARAQFEDQVIEVAA